jgi:microcystin-dependent protein
MQQITFQDKVNINNEPSIPEINKLTDDNINKMKQAINLNAPAGVISMYGGSTAPSGWLLCDGSAVSRTTYARLFSAIGTKYGSGNGSTTFNLPNFKGRVPVGLDSSQSEFNSLNKRGGEKTHKLTINEMPSHNHAMNNTSYSDTNVNHTVMFGTDLAHGDTHYWNYSNPTFWTSNVGGGQAHNNLQPYITVNYIISY